MTIKSLATIIVVVTLLGSGCTTVNNIRPGGGTQFTAKGHSHSDVWNAAIRAVRSSRDLSIEKFSESSGTIIATNDRHFTGSWSWGEVVAVYIETNNATEGIDVEVVSKHRSTCQLTGPNYEADLEAGIKAELSRPDVNTHVGEPESGKAKQE